MITLRPYQNDLVKQLRDAFRLKENPILVLPTGGGKTVIAGGLAQAGQSKGTDIWFLCHRDFLVLQTHKTFIEMGVDHGVLAASKEFPSGWASTMVVAVDTLRARRHTIARRPRIVVWDECHHTASETWEMLWEWFGPDCFHIGLTATPQRLDGKGLAPRKEDGPGFQRLILGPTVEALMKMGNLSGYRAFAPSTMNVEGVHTLGGDFNLRELGQAAASVIVGDVVGHYQKLAMGKRAVYFTVNIAESQRLCAAFNAAGIVAEHIDGTDDIHERRAKAARFAKGETMVLTNCALVAEGYDLAAQAGIDVTIEAVGLVRPTQSLALHLQQMGRALRPKQDPAIIIDHAGNIARHGLPDEERAWSLQGRGRSSSPCSVKTCPACFGVVPIQARVCTECGHEFITAPRALPAQVEGELVEVDRTVITPRQRRAMIANCRTYPDFVRVGKELGFKPGWAYRAHQEYVTLGAVQRPPQRWRA